MGRYLFQLETLLSTRGDEWAMLQDTQGVVQMIERVQLMMLPANEDAPDGVALRGGAHMPALCLQRW